MGEEALSAVWLQAGLNSDRPLNEIIVVVVVAVATFDECLEWRELLLPLLLQTGPTVSNGWTIVVVVAIFSNVSSGGSGCWPTTRFGAYQLYEGESVKMVQSGNIT